MNRAFLVVLFALLFVSSACDWADSSGIDYPGAKDWREVSLAELKYPDSAPDKVNVVAYVILIFECPDGWNCESPDGLLLSETMYRGDIDWDMSVEVRARPHGFRIGSKYRLSVKITGGSATGQYFTRQLEGYDTIFVGEETR